MLQGVGIVSLMLYHKEEGKRPFSNTHGEKLMTKRSRTAAGFLYPATLDGMNLLEKSIRLGIATDLKHLKVLRRYNMVILASAYKGYYHAALGLAEGEIDDRPPSYFDERFDDFGVAHRIEFPHGFGYGKIYRIPHSIAIPSCGFTLPVVEDIVDAILNAKRIDKEPAVAA